MAQTNVHPIRPIQEGEKTRFDEMVQKKAIEKLRGKLMAATVRFVREATGTRAHRLREASALSGIPINLIDVAEEQCQA